MRDIDPGFVKLANVYASMGTLLFYAACQWPFLWTYPYRRPILRVIQGGRA